MENIIEALLRIEEQADQYLANVEHKRKDGSAQVREQIDELKETLDMKTREQIRRLTEESEGQTRVLIDEITSEGRTRMQKMEAGFAENRNKWEEELVQRILIGE